LEPLLDKIDLLAKVDGGGAKGWAIERSFF